ncbi:MAG: sugar ABC transporter substrate-binding protein [Actinomycetia bacterium]|nr:sugar ABC transporter substrate-binding protein [Actinomycetes bacterium]
MQIASLKRDGARRFGVVAGVLVLALALVAGACSSSDGESSTDPDAPVTLRVAMGSPGEAQIEVWEATAASFEASNPNVTVEFNFQDDDLYETIGLPNLLNGGDAPDVYFEWAGQRLQDRYDEGFVADITDAVQNGELGTYFEEGAYNGMVIDGKNVMVPANADVTTVMWYNVDIFNDLGISVPTTWDEMIAASEIIKAAGVIPIGIGNKDLWPVGNWTSHILSRAMGEETYDQMLKQEIPMDSPEIVAAMEYVVELQQSGTVNESVNAIDDNEGAELFFQGKAAMHPIGSWLVSWAIESAPDLNFDYFNLPPLEGAGTQDSVIAVSTGFIVNAESSHQDVAIDFLTLFSSPEFTSQMVDAGGTPLATGALDRDDIDPRILSLMEMMQTAGALVAPPDTGYDIEVADALYAAEAEVLGGVSTPEEALATAQAKIGG